MESTEPERPAAPSSSPPRTRGAWLTLLAAPLVLFAAFFPFVAFLASKGELGDDPAQALEPIAVYPATLGFVALLAFTRWMAKREGLSLGALGWRRPSLVDLAAGLAAGAAFAAVQQEWLHPWLIELRPSFDPKLTAMSLAAALVMLTCAMVAEDTLYRGYALVVLRRRHGAALAAVVTTVFYAGLAPGQGWPLIVFTLGLGAVLVVVRLWRGNLWPALIVHLMAGLTPKVLEMLG